MAALADPLSMSPGESLSRVQMFLLNLPRPELQQEIRDAEGLVGVVDFGWDGVVGEFDGKVKYRSTRARTAGVRRGALAGEAARGPAPTAGARRAPGRGPWRSTPRRLAAVWRRTASDHSPRPRGSTSGRGAPRRFAGRPGAAGGARAGDPRGVRGTSFTQDVLAESGRCSTLTRRSAPDFAEVVAQGGGGDSVLAGPGPGSAGEAGHLSG